jgi:hypothetical protein
VRVRRLATLVVLFLILLASRADAVNVGMSAPKDQWAQRLSETGPVYARRLFGNLSSPDSIVTLARSEIAAGRYPITSFKLPNDDWTGAAAGRYDSLLRSLRDKLDALPGRVFVAIHHEPNGDGTARNFAAMQRRVLPILRSPSNVEAGVIMNGFIWSPRSYGLSDTEIALWLPSDVRRLCEIVAADFYHGGTPSNPGEEPEVKIRSFSAWATRVGVTRLGIGEYNGHTAGAITRTGEAFLADPRFAFASIFNSSENNREGVNWVLTGDRLAAFKATVAASR